MQIIKFPTPNPAAIDSVEDLRRELSYAAKIIHDLLSEIQYMADQGQEHQAAHRLLDAMVTHHMRGNNDAVTQILTVIATGKKLAERPVERAH